MNDETLEQVSLRLPSGLSEAIRKRAKRNRRSLNQEATFLLERAVSGEVKEGEAA